MRQSLQHKFCGGRIERPLQSAPRPPLGAGATNSSPPERARFPRSIATTWQDATKKCLFLTLTTRTHVRRARTQTPGTPRPLKSYHKPEKTLSPLEGAVADHLLADRHDLRRGGQTRPPGHAPHVSSAQAITRLRTQRTNTREMLPRI